MTKWEAVVLGLIQGITEYLPVSSSGHLEIAQHLFGLQNLKRFVLFDLVCHLGTLLALIIVLKKQIVEALFGNRRKFTQISIATLPLFPLVLLIQPIKEIFDQPQYLGFCFVLTSLFLYASQRCILQIQSHPARSWSDPLVIGIVQAIAILPGVSRSGSTISCARMLGWKLDDAVVFSMLLAIPAILGGTFLEVIDLVTKPATLSTIDLWHYFLGFISSFLTGLFSLWLLLRIAKSEKFHYFAIYCFLLGIWCVIYFNLL